VKTLRSQKLRMLLTHRISRAVSIWFGLHVQNPPG